MNIRASKGDVPAVIRNDDRLYEGDLVYYLRVLWKYAPNLHKPYHNLRHMLHVTWLCYRACKFYRDKLTPRQMRSLLIAAMFHDFDHTGTLGHDDLNIIRALRGLAKHIDPADKDHEAEIAQMIRGTQYPYVIEVEELDLCGQILRDADVSQAFSVAWVQQVVLGLASEWSKTPLEVLRMQEPFLGSLVLRTEWARREFPESDIRAKMEEAHELLALLDDTPAAQA